MVSTADGGGQSSGAAYAAIENLTGSARQKSTTENAIEIAPNVVDDLRRVLGPARRQPMARANTRAPWVLLK